MKILLTTLPGLVEAVVKELTEKGFSAIRIVKPSHVVTELNPKEASKLRTIEGFSQIIQETFLEKVETRIIRLTLRRVFKELEEEKYRPEARVYGKCFNNRFLEKIAARELVRTLGNEVLDKEGRKILLILDCENKHLLVTLKLNKKPLHLREYYLMKHPTPLNPLIAAAIPYLSPKNYKIVYDPFTGSGTIPIEYYLIRRVKTLASDINKRFVKATIVNSQKAGAHVDVFSADVRKTPVRDIELVTTDPPRKNPSVLKPLMKNTPNDLCLVTPYNPDKLAEKYGLKPVKKVKTRQAKKVIYII